MTIDSRLSPGESYAATLHAGDLNGDGLTYSITSTPTKGVLNLVNATTGSFTYAANSNEIGADSFRFKVNDGIGDSQIADVTINVAPTGIQPMVTGGISHSLALKRDGTVWSWGLNTLRIIGDIVGGQLGDGTSVDRLNTGASTRFDQRDFRGSRGELFPRAQDRRSAVGLG